MKKLPHWVVGALLVVTIVCAVIVPQVWPAVVLVAVAGGLYVVGNQVYSGRENKDEKLGAEGPR